MSTEQLTQTPGAHTPAPRSPGRRFTQGELGLILSLNAEGLSQVQIAQRLECDQSAISYALKRLGTDTTGLAIHAARASSYRAVKRLDAVVRKGSDDHAIRASGKLLEVAEVLNAGSKGVSLGVQVIIGDGPDPLAGAKVVNVCTTDGAK
jgi:biotin synthase-related radical SAM superfamily protein